MVSRSSSGKPAHLLSDVLVADATSRNGRTGDLLDESHYSADTPTSQLSCRVRRSILQAALLKEVDKSKVKLSTRLVGLEKLSNGQVKINFDDSSTDQVDLLVAADGIRSVSPKTFQN
jgi:2-polyprenyl-6-methoxyphenol hydroxylase-like FAD-dependent oxidoreductase